jgi:hypothetical protein
MHQIVCKSRNKYDGDLDSHWTRIRGRKEEPSKGVSVENSELAKTERGARRGEPSHEHEHY